MTKWLRAAIFNTKILLFAFALGVEVSVADNFVCDSTITNTVLDRYQNLTNYRDHGELTTNKDDVFTFETIYTKLDELRFIFHAPQGYGAYNKLSYIMSGKKFISIFESDRFAKIQRKEKAFSHFYSQQQVFP